ncbi:hypothetical protein BD770DRAFT_66172 [Pilaira anomala]|nr:hypothetical protein BD770DRAFT_66172 [Pilaira anomala]
MSKTSTIIKPYLRKFILQTHPDFFHNDTIKKQTNASSLQKLQNILQPQQRNAIKATTCQLEFFTKQIKPVKKQKPQAVIQFHGNDSEWSTAQSFFDLCKQVDIPILKSDLDIVNNMILQELNKNKPKSQHKSLTKEFAERLYKQYNELNTNKTVEWTPNQILQQKLVVFGPDVNKKMFVNQLSAWLPQLNPERWWGKVPCMIISPETEYPSKDLTRGILVIKSDMKLQDIKDYFDTHLDNVINENSK